MSKSNKQPLNITINGNELNDNNNKDEYENYVINSNKELHKLNKELENKIIKLENDLENKDDELDKEEAKRIYMKGMLHSFNEIKKKLSKSNKKYKELNETYKDCFELYKNTFYILNKYCSADNTQYVITFGLIIPIILTSISYLFNSSLFSIILIFYNIFLFMIIAYICDEIYNEKNVNFFKKIKELNIINERTYKEIKKLEEEVKEIEKAIQDIDVIIDDC
tara:strand:+ start:1176 stop:1844 length:669 start_codon:yes stop_codon:yes gene_type:complete